jgi:DNA-binding transcriptional MerR regulator
MKRLPGNAGMDKRAIFSAESHGLHDKVSLGLASTQVDFTLRNPHSHCMTDSAPSDRSRFYSVAELANEFSLTSQGIRFYEESGLIAPARVGRTRVFNYQDRARLILIQRLRRLGFSIDAIREYLSLYKADATGATQYRRGLERIVERIRELESKRLDLDETLAGLRVLEREAHDRLDRALIDESRTQRSKNTNGKRDLRNTVKS